MRRKEEKIFIVGCGHCAAKAHSGGESVMGEGNSETDAIRGGAAMKEVMYHTDEMAWQEAKGYPAGAKLKVLREGDRQRAGPCC